MSSQHSSSTAKQQVMQLAQTKRFEEARELGQKLCKQDPGDAEAWFLLGAVHGQLGEFPEAETCCRQALELQPAHAGLLYNLAIALLKQNKLDAASDCYRQTLELNPDFAAAYSELAALYIHRLNYDEAVALLEPAVKRLPDVADLHLKLGVAHYEQGHIDDALHAYHHALKLEPHHVDAIYALGRIKRMQGHLTEAQECFEKALAIKPEHTEALAVLGGVKKEQGRVDESLVAFRKALVLQPDRADIHSSLLLNLNYTPNVSPQESFSEHCRWGKLHGKSRGVDAVADNSRVAGRRLRVGYVSPDFRTHSVAYFFEPLLLQHDKSNVECYCYADLRLHRADDTTLRLKQHADHWRDITYMSDSEAADRIRADGIDILVDLAGHTAGNRLGVFALKPAPIQISYLGYPNTTGLSAMDYRITDCQADPEVEADRFCVESLIRLPTGFLCYQPPEAAPAPGPVPALSNGFITFGSFNNLAKLTPEMINLWAELLNSVENARLLLKNSSFRDEPTREYCYARFLKAGVERERLSLTPGTASLKAHLAAYNSVDIALDTFPYNGTTTTFEALWMGVPVVTLSGATHASRVGLSILSHTGLGNLVATSADDYLAIATRLAVDARERSKLRKNLRERLGTSPLCNAKEQTLGIEAAYRKAWKTWCKASR